jgi:pyridoxal phosphate enzyme (YggS family)
MTRDELIAKNIDDWKKRLNGVKICAVTKTMPVSDLNAAVRAGADAVGENRVQELTDKLEKIEPGAQVHLIGRLQTNKVRYIIGKVDLIQSLDRDELALEISKRSVQKDTATRALVQVNIAREPQKGGVDPDALFPLLERLSRLPGLQVDGLMAVMPLADDPEDVRPHMKRMRALFEEAARAKIPGVSMNILSMGMSGDCLVAAEEGSTMVRIGRGIFGARA